MALICSVLIHLIGSWNETLRCPAYFGVTVCGVLPILEYGSAVSCLSRSLTLRCPACLGVTVCGVLSISEIDSAVSCLSRSHSLRCPVYLGNWLSCVLTISEFDSTVSCCLSRSQTLRCVHPGVWLWHVRSNLNMAMKSKPNKTVFDKRSGRVCSMKKSHGTHRLKGQSIKFVISSLFHKSNQTTG